MTSGFSEVSGRFNTFEHGAIYFNGSVHFVWNLVYAGYQRFNGAAGPLGFPTTDEFINQQGQAESDFENGFITFDFITGKTSVTVFPSVG